MHLAGFDLGACRERVRAPPLASLISFLDSFLDSLLVPGLASLFFVSPLLALALACPI
jgi:hypothetical protein